MPNDLHPQQDGAAMRRRAFLTLLAGSGAAAAFAAFAPELKISPKFAFAATPAATQQAAASVAPDAALKELVDGNQRYSAAKLQHPDQTEGRRVEVAQGQHPFALILSCSDSRVPPEIVFDQGLGDLFVIRTAGNISDDIVLGSIEFGVEELGISLIMVLGHERCGAVTAAVNGEHVPGHIEAVVKAIQPAVEKVKDQSGDKVDNAVKANALMVAEQLQKSEPILAEKVKAGKLKIVAARYDLDSGLVEMLS